MTLFIIEISGLRIVGITRTGNAAAVSVFSGPAGWIKVILVDANGREQRRYCKFCMINLLYNL